MSLLSCFSRRCVGGGLFWLFLFSVHAEVREDELFPTERLRVRSVATRTTPILNPIRWPQFEFRVPDGSRVNEGDVIFRANNKGTLGAIRDLEEQFQQTENEIQGKNEQLAKSVDVLSGKLQNLKDEKSIQQAHLEYLESLPLKKNVQIAQGKLELAELQYEATEADLTKAQERQNVGLVSPAEVEEALYQLNLQTARLAHAKRSLSLAKGAAHPKSLEIIHHRIKNLDLEINKLEFEIKTQEELRALETASFESKIDNLNRKLKERKDELENLVIRAPRAGVVIYSNQFKRELASGGKPPIGLVLAEIPHPDSIAFEGEIPERVRPLYAVGDPVQITLNANPDEVLHGVLSTISPFSREKEEEESNGVKVLDIQLKVEHLQRELPVGLYGWAVLTTAEPRKGASVPLNWVVIQAGKPHVSLDGLYQPVNGIVNGDRFQFTAPPPPLDQLQPEGAWPTEETTELVMEGDRFHTSGEVEPLQSIGVKAPHVWARDMKVAMLHPENTLIQKGDIIAKLDSESLRQRSENYQTRLENSKKTTESAEKELQLRLRERDFQIQEVETKLTIAQLERDLEVPGIKASVVYQSMLNVQTAHLNLEHAKKKRARLEKNSDLIAPRKLREAVREVSRKELEYERAEIQLHQAKQGVSDEQRSLSNLAVIKVEAEAAKIHAAQSKEVANAQSKLYWQKWSLARWNKQHQNVLQSIEDMTLMSPADGLVKYEKTWDGVEQNKFKTGMRAYRGTKLLSLSSTGPVFVDTLIPERYVQKLNLGMSVDIQIPSEGNQIWKGELSMMGEILVPLSTPPVAESLYANREPHPRQALPVRILIQGGDVSQLKPGAIAHVLFPFAP